MIAAVAVPAMSIMVKHFDLGLLSAEPAAVLSEKEIALPETTYAAAEIIAGDSGTGFQPVSTARMAVPPELPAVEQYVPVAAVAAEKTEIPWSGMLSWAWIAASLILAARLVVTSVRGIRLLRRASPLRCQEIQAAARVAKAKLGITEEVSVLGSRNVHSPVIWCWRKRPALLVPAAAAQPGDGIDWVSVLCHELAHYKRHDHISGLLGEIVLCALPWNPFLWLAKERLVRLSEQACDDWVVAAGQSSADYARSLLDLVPQSQLALLPTVVASKKELQTRVRRIVQNHCGDPRAGGRWAILAAIVAACLALGTALAQEGRTDKETPRREAAAPEHRQEGEVSREQDQKQREAERAELIQLRQTLLEKISGIERELKALRDDQDVEARELQARLSAIRDEVRRLDAQLGGPEREAEIRNRVLLAEREALEKHLHELAQALERLPTGRDQEAREVQAEMQVIREKMRRVEAKLHDVQRYDQKQRERERPEADPRVRELTEQRKQLEKKARDMDRSLAERPDSPEAKELRAGLREMHEQIQRINQELAELQRPPRERSEPELPRQAYFEELRQAIARAVEQARSDDAAGLERALRQITERPATRPEPRPEAPGLEQQVRQLRNEVQGLRQEMAELREMLKQLLQRQRPEQERSREAERPEEEPRPEKEEIGVERPRF
jgi:beta-lactamase regulating signal transducer with metallopeptidase domain